MIVQDPKTGKNKKVRKVIPDYIPDHDAHVLGQARKFAYNMDMALFDFGGVRFGYSSLIGLVPG